MSEIAGRTALITGGASGIGLLMGEMLLENGLQRLIVWDMSEANIAVAFERLGPKAEFRRIDVTDTAAGMLSNPGMSVYCASKWAVVGWSDSLRLEMEADNTGVRVTTVLPFYIDTGMFNGVKSPMIPILKPEPTARKIIRAIESNRVLLRMPPITNLLPLLRGILPLRVFDLIVGRCFGIYKSMSEFKGRKG